MPILFMALIALAVFGGIGTLLCTACFAEHRHNRTKAASASAQFVPEPPKLKARAARGSY